MSGSSMLWQAHALAAAVDGRFGKVGDRPSAVTGVSIDTRTLQPGDLFVALRGDRSDGHAHAGAALAAGAAAVLAHDPEALSPDLRDDARLLFVTDTFEALHALGRAGRARFDGRVIAVTGSVGKTTTKEMLRAALGACGPTHASHASYNNHWGVPLTLARLPADAAFCVSEIGMNHPGEIAPLAALVRPHAAIVTTVAASHIGHMGSLEAIAAEKGSIFGALESHGTAILPADAVGADAMAAMATARGARVMRCGAGGDARIEHLSLRADGSDIVMRIADQTLSLTLGAPGAHMARNALAVLAAAIAVGADPEAAAAGLSGFRPGDGRGALVPLPNGAFLLDESYNASGASVRAALELLALLPAGRRVVALGDMLELGRFAAEEHLSLAPALERCADLFFCCGPMSRLLFDTLPAPLRGGAAPDARTLAPLVAAALRPGDVLLVKGSFGSRMREVVSILRSSDHSSRSPEQAA
ncbi:UDP-N-acetylmuramoyl-tripeptide--D-alanyl-D-alanine ligase [Rhizosaccharibacter radicis]|uniref:UDP-N-acetylmuramoyl-tripeptide--D-alanyl-D-alanine ligase n=1 Tax=Rhizosaccharibacter radicis TaxID=2782605 RepID=A0ABT1VY34_9PROT|nr:UDP-N-acetylmuramoyl-tripeptide--D-alanyl-D-alanine ligase [Acetobacteraceae bacterium KSS12]